MIETGVHCPAVEDEHRRRVHVRTRRHTRRDPREEVPRLSDPVLARIWREVLEFKDEQLASCDEAPEL